MGWSWGGSRRRREERHQATIAEATSQAISHADILARTIAQIEASRLIAEFADRLQNEQQQRDVQDLSEYQRQMTESSRLEQVLLGELDPELRALAQEIAREMGVTLEGNVRDILQQAATSVVPQATGNTQIITITNEQELDRAIEQWCGAKGPEKYALIKNQATGQWYVCEKNYAGQLVDEGFLDEMADVQDFMHGITIAQPRRSQVTSTTGIDLTGDEQVVQAATSSGMATTSQVTSVTVMGLTKEEQAVHAVASSGMANPLDDEQFDVEEELERTLTLVKNDAQPVFSDRTLQLYMQVCAGQQQDMKTIEQQQLIAELEQELGIWRPTP